MAGAFTRRFFAGREMSSARIVNRPIPPSAIAPQYMSLWVVALSLATIVCTLQTLHFWVFMLQVCASVPMS